MTKFSQIPPNNSPALADYLVGVTVGGVDDRITLSQLAALVSANITANAVKSAAIDFSTIVKTFVNQQGQINYANPSNFGGVWTDLTGFTWTWTPDRNYTVMAFTEIRGGNGGTGNRQTRILQNGNIITPETSQKMNTTGETLAGFGMVPVTAGVAQTIKAQFSSDQANDIIYSGQMMVLALPS